MIRQIVVCSVGVLMFLHQYSWGQSIRHKLAHQALERFHYAEAARYYESLHKKYPNDTLILEQLALCYYKLNQSQQAALYLGKLMQQRKSPTQTHILWYAQMLARQKQYEQARQWYARYTADERGQRFLTFYDQSMEQLLGQASMHTISPVSFNQANTSDFAPAFFEDRLVFCSDRQPKSNGWKKRQYRWLQSPYLDLYLGKADQKDVYPFSKAINSAYHDGPAVFFNNYQNIVFTRSNYYNGKYKHSHNGTNHLQLFFAERLADGSWGNIQPFIHNNSEYSIGHPAISPDGKQLYFVSDMPGGYGETDIYVCYFENGQWSQPINLGKQINTPGREVFPFIDAKGNLFFASDGHGGFGGLDIFMAEYVNGKLQAPENLGKPFNSSQDDFSLIVDESGQKGYFASNRNHDGTLDEILAFKGKALGNYRTLLISCVNQENGKPLPYATIHIITADSDTLSLTCSDTGECSYAFHQKQSYQLMAEQTDFEPVAVLLTPQKQAIAQQKGKLYIELKPKVRSQCTLILSDEQNHQAVSGELIVYNKLSHEIIKQVSNTSQVVMDGIEPGVYIIKATAKGYFFYQDTLHIPHPESKLEKKLYMKPLRKKSVLVLNNINFEFASDRLTAEARQELENIYQLMLDNPSLHIAIYAHTDAIGDARRNLELSNRRAQAVFHYLVNKGIDAKRMIWKGFGKSQPIASNATAEGRARNRRVEFVVLSIDDNSI